MLFNKFINENNDENNVLLKVSIIKHGIGKIIPICIDVVQIPCAFIWDLLVAVTSLQMGIIFTIPTTF